MHFSRLVDRFGRRRALQWAGIRVMANMQQAKARTHKAASQRHYREEFIDGFEKSISLLRDSISEAKVLKV